MSTTAYGVANPALVAEMTGLEFLQAMVDGRVPRPPMGQRIPFELHEFEHGRLVLRTTVDDTYLNPGGIVHGGLALTALDTAMGLAVLTTLGRGKGFASTDTSVRFIRALPGGKDHHLEIVGTVVSSGRTTATASGEMRAIDGKLIATSTGACAIISAPS